MPTSRKSSRRPYQGGHIPLDESRLRGGLRVETTGNGEWAVRSVTSDKPVLCPGCNQMIPVGVNHQVAWRRDGWQGEAAGLADRRHWHTSCWARHRR